MKKKLNSRNKPFKESYLTKFFRWFSYPITKLLVKTAITPNQVTIIGFVLTVAAAIMFASTDYQIRILGGVIFFVGAILDHCDGEIARIKNKQSVFGRWLDGTLDRIGDVLVFIGISIGLFREKPELIIIIIVLFATISTTLWRLLSEYTVKSFQIPQVKKDQPKIGFDAPMTYILITIAAVSNTFLYVMILFAVIINLAWIKNTMMNYFKYKKNI